MARGADSLFEVGGRSLFDESDTTAPAPAPANDEDANPTKVLATTIATEFLCPVTHELPIAPVMAKDGVVYERAAIERWFETKEGDPTSPSTGAVIGTELVPVPQIRNALEALVKSGAIDGEVATAWKLKLADETKVKECRAKAGDGDGEAMYRLGAWYQFGNHGLAKDDVQARAWYERSAAARYPKGMAMFGDYLLKGWSGPQDNIFGIMNATEAAGLGSDVAACNLGEAFFKGEYGLPKDPARARFWLKKVVDGKCEYKHLNKEWMAKCCVWFRELDDVGDY